MVVSSRRARMLAGMKPTHRFGRAPSCDADAAADAVDLVAVPAASLSPPHAPPPAALLLLPPPPPPPPLLLLLLLQVAVTVLLVPVLLLIGGGARGKKLLMLLLPVGACWVLLCFMRW